MANTLTQWRPVVYFDRGDGQYDSKVFPTYRELKKHMPIVLNLSNYPATVFRTRRGKWGEWFEDWERIKGKPTIIRKGWM